MSSRPWRALFVFVFALIGLAAPASTQAGGGVAPGGKGGGSAPAGKGGGSAPGGGVSAAASITVDHAPVQGKSFSFLDFYPRSATVHQGDVVDFHFVESNSNSFHTVTFVPAGAPLTNQSLARLLPAGGGPTPDRDDPGPSVAFGFNLLQRACGNSPYFPGTAPCSYDGRSIVNSGVEFPNAPAETGKYSPTPPTHFSVRMNVRPGVYHYFCLVHGPDMGGTITVAPAGAPVPSRAQQSQNAEAQFKPEAAQQAALLAHAPAPAQQSQGGHTVWTIGAGLPAPRTSKLEPDVYSAPNLSIKAGDTVVWQPLGFHTVTFPRYAGVAALSLQCETTHGPDRVINSISAVRGCVLEPSGGRGLFPTGPSGAAYTGGFSNSGALVLPKPHAWAVTFPTAGTYRYQCLIHFGMLGTVTVH